MIFVGVGVGVGVGAVVIVVAVAVAIVIGAIVFAMCAGVTVGFDQINAYLLLLFQLT